MGEGDRRKGMARIIHAHPRHGGLGYHIYTDLDFWDARRILRGLLPVRRNFGEWPSGRVFPTHIAAETIDPETARTIEHRLTRAVPSPPRHVVVEEILARGWFEFDPRDYCPARWSPTRMLHFSAHRLPVQQPPLATPHHEVRLTWSGERIRAERVRRESKHDPVISDVREAKRRRFAPSCF
jgi:hypothetical protein